MPKPPVIGLLGGGQLGRMLCEAVLPLGYEVVVLDAQDCPAKQVNVNSKHVNGSFADPQKVKELAARCDVLTVEIEHVNTHVLEEIAEHGILTSSGASKRVTVHPSWRTLRLVQDKFQQKEHFKTKGLPIAEQLALSGEDISDSLSNIGRKFGYPFMVKSRTGSYDGRGNVRVGGPNDYESVKALGTLPLYAEKWIPFVMELAVMVVRTEIDSTPFTHSFPVVETIHEDSICRAVYMPPRKVDAKLCDKTQELAEKVVQSLWGNGVFAVEMFLLADGSILVNEVAPRPHNSGHYTIEAVPYMSQYKAQLYAITNRMPERLKLKPRFPRAAMLNILGGLKDDSYLKLAQMAEEHFQEDVDTYLHLYGKASKPGRKIGHITCTSTTAASDLEESMAPLIHEADRMRRERLASAVDSRPAEPQAGRKQSSSRTTSSPLVVVTMGSDSDLSVLSVGLEILEQLGVPYDCRITSAHRTPARMMALAQGAAAQGVKVLIAAAGGAAHLPGMLASETTLPVIGVPIKATHLDGKDSLLSIVQMPRGIPVATVGINNATNAALLAVRILGSEFPEYREKMAKYMATMKHEVEEKADRLHEIGYRAYLGERAK